MNKTEVVYKQVDELIPYINNPRYNDQAVDAVASSIKNFGFKVPIVIDSKNEIVNGHTRLKAAKKLGLTEVPVIVAGDLTPEQIKAFRIADNKVSEIAEWNEELLAIELEELENLGVQMSEYGFDIELEQIPDPVDESELYTQKVDIPQYQITGEEPEIEDMLDTEKADSLIERIEGADVPEDVKEFLFCAAVRHYVFNYEAIAEYYAHADKEVQELFEESALVIIDFEDAIKNGYVKLNNQLNEMRLGGEVIDE